MRNLSQVCLLLGALWWAQAKPAAPAQPSSTNGATDAGAKQPASVSTVRADDAVITIKGLCSPAEARAKNSTDLSCETVITREGFERLSDAIQANMTATSKRQLATSYPRILVMSREAEQRGLDKDERVQELLAYSRAQILSQELFRNIQKQASEISQQDIDSYYREHTQSFQRATLERILVPITKEPATSAKDKALQTGPQDEKVEQENREAMVKEAEQLRERAAAGEDFAKLQKAAYDAARVDAPIPRTKLNWRRGSLPASHLSVMDLKIGEISAVISDSTGHYIYKIDSKEIEPEAEATPEIRTILQKQRTKEMMDRLQAAASTELNQSYFGAPEAPKPPDFSKVKPESDDQ